jgi:hypothetical protein
VVTGALVVGGSATAGTAAAGVGNGRVGHYHLNNIRPDGTVEDASPEANHGTNHGATVARGGGQVGNAFYFDGDAAHVDAGDIAGADGTRTVTLAAWLNPETRGQGDFVTKNTSGDRSNSSWVLRYDGTGNQHVSAHFNDDDDNWTVIRSGATVPTGSFTHVAVTLDGNQRRLYVDGELDSADSYAEELDDESAPVVLGAADQSGGGVTNEFTGMLDEVRIYDRALSSQEVASLASMGGNGRGDGRGNGRGR